MTVSATGPTAPTSRLILFRALHTVSQSTQFGAALWRNGFLYVTESRTVPTAILALPAGRTRQTRLRSIPTTVETTVDLDLALTRFEQIVEQEMADAQSVYSFARPASLDDGSLARAVLDGTEHVTDALTMAELVRQIYPTNDGAARQQILRFVREAPLTWGYWAGWKWLYKQAEAADDVELLTEVYRRLDNEPVWLEPAIATPIPFIDRYPSPRTIRYLRRRMRRYQEQLRASNPDAWTALQTKLIPCSTPSADTPTIEAEPVVEPAPVSDAHELFATAMGSTSDVDAKTIAAVYWSTATSAASRNKILTVIEQMLMSNNDMALPVVEALTRGMVMSPGPDFASARHGFSEFLGAAFDAVTSALARARLAGCIWQTGNGTLMQRMHMELMQAPLAELAMWVASLRAAAPPDLAKILADVEARIRFTVWDPDDLRLVAPIVMSLDAPDLRDRVVDLIPDWFQREGTDLIDLFDHPIPKVAAWAKRQATEVGMPGRSLLRLAESNRRSDLAMLTHAAEKLPVDDSDLWACIEHLVGDPRPQVRRIGIGLARRHQASLPPQRAVLALTGTRERHAWLLALDILVQEAAAVGEVPSLTISALRGRWAKPQQRESLMRAIEACPQQYVQTLLAIARSGWPVQQEWALRLLIAVARDGSDVPGFALTEEQALYS